MEWLNYSRRWLSVAIRAVQSFPVFIGYNWVGVLLSCVLVLSAARASIKNHLIAIRPLPWSGKFVDTGRALVAADWRTVVSRAE